VVVVLLLVFEAVLEGDNVKEGSADVTLVWRP